MHRTTITFAILDDKITELQRLTKSIENKPNTKVVFHAQNEEELLNYLASADPLPTYILIDIKIGPDFKKGYRIVENIHREYKSIFIILLSEYPDKTCLLYTSPSPRDATLSRMPSSA